jgi:hypothetical protein
MSHFRSGRSEIYVYSSDDTYTWVAVGCSALFGLARSPELFEYVAINSDHGVTIGDEFVTVTLRLVEEQDDQVTLQLTHRIPAVHFITWTTDPPKSLVYSSLISVAVLAVSRAAASLVTRLQPRFGGSTWYAD